MCSKEKIILSPEVQKLKDECSLLREELAGLYTERDHLLNTVAANIQAKYATTVGVKEYEALALDIEVRRLKRTIELIQAIENQGNKANLEQIEASVEVELAEWREKVEKMCYEIEKGKDRLQNLMPGEDSQELLKLYRSIAKKLHPDVNPNLEERHKVLWTRVQIAYEAGDLPELRALQLLVEDIQEKPASSNSINILRERHSQLKEQVRNLLRQIDDMKAKPPFTLVDKLADPVWVNAQISECEKRIKTFSAEQERLEGWISLWKGKK